MVRRADSWLCVQGLLLDYCLFRVPYGMPKLSSLRARQCLTYCTITGVKGCHTWLIPRTEPRAPHMQGRCSPDEREH